MELNRQELIRLSKSDISEREIKSVVNVLKKGFLGMGEEVKTFESKLSNYSDLSNSTNEKKCFYRG